MFNFDPNDINLNFENKKNNNNINVSNIKQIDPNVGSIKQNDFFSKSVAENLEFLEEQDLTPKKEENSKLVELKERFVNSCKSFINDIMEKIKKPEEEPMQNTQAIEEVKVDTEVVQAVANYLEEKKEDAHQKKLEGYAGDFADYANGFIGAGANPLRASTEWCLMFVNHCLKSNGSFNDIKGFDTSILSCSAQIRYINENNPDALHLFPGRYNGVTESDYMPKKGDIFFIENQKSDRGSYVVRHVGIVDDVKLDESGKIISIETVEGNIGTGGSYNSRKVEERTYVPDEQGRFRCQYSNNYINENCVIYGFFDTANNIIEE